MMHNLILERKLIDLLNVLVVLSLLSSLLILAFITPLIFDSFRRGYAWEEMDWNNDDHTSLAEFVASAKINKNIYRDSDNVDIEYSRHKTAIKSLHNNVIKAIKPGSIEAVALQAFYNNHIYFYDLLIKIMLASAAIMLVSNSIKFRLERNRNL